MNIFVFMQNGFDLLIQKLDQFTRKYYLNQLIRGSLYTVGLVLLFFLLINLAESSFYFSKGMRKVLWFSFLGVSLAAIGWWVARPLLQYFRLGKVISHDQAASIIGLHFGDVQDKLLNVLQLRRQADQQGAADLIVASINQNERLNPTYKDYDLLDNVGKGGIERYYEKISTKYQFRCAMGKCRRIFSRSAGWENR